MINGICKILDCHYGAVPNDDCETEWVPVKVDRAGNQTLLSGPVATEEEAESIAAEEHRLDLEQFGAGE